MTGLRPFYSESSGFARNEVICTTSCGGGAYRTSFKQILLQAAVNVCEDRSIVTDASGPEIRRWSSCDHMVSWESDDEINANVVSGDVIGYEINLSREIAEEVGLGQDPLIAPRPPGMLIGTYEGRIIHRGSNLIIVLEYLE
ncbi:hypothetical protein QAD02_002947 [Eretmocerus hayati]|uniref:Uncharacterized protein n=1 Tax=Eretmocerus hayati TaxID=131215 RepID=A0ACC2NLJ0_9HYME|nr:hypothetical protein QAD02_002947 [Eretmocerus hayati]